MDPNDKKTILDLHNNNLTEIPSYISEMIYLQKLDLSRNKITKIPQGFFKDLDHLKLLDLSQNINLTTLPDGYLFGGTKSLERLYLNFIKITEIKPETFENLPKLKILSLSYSNIVEINSKSFYKLPLLEELILEGNNITEIKPQTFTNLPKLKILNLSHNENLTTLSPEAFNLPELEKLNLTSTRITEIKPGTFSNLPKLETLDISWVFIEEIQPGTFKNLPKLKTLDLSYNDDLRTLHPKAFYDLPSLEKLDLSETRINPIKTGIFVDLPKLKELDLSSNNSLTIFILYPKAFYDLPSLEKLNLSGTGIRKITLLRTFHVKGSTQGLPQQSIEFTNLNRLVVNLSGEKLIVPGSQGFKPDSFIKLESLGAGKYGEVYKAKNKITGEVVAIKKIPKNKVKLLNFQREVEMLEKVEQSCKKYLLCYIDNFEDEDNYYLVTEFLDDYKPLTDYINYITKQINKQKYIEFESLFEELINGLKIIHSFGLAHRDIKPDNILIRKDKNGFKVKYIDFGFACQKNVCSINFSGTPIFVAPEIWLSSLRSLTEYQKSDIFALGSVFLKIVSDRNLLGFYLAEFENLRSYMVGIGKIYSYPGTGDIGVLVKYVANILKLHYNIDLENFLAKYPRFRKLPNLD